MRGTRRNPTHETTPHQADSHTLHRPTRGVGPLITGNIVKTGKISKNQTSPALHADAFHKLSIMQLSSQS